MQIYYNKSKTVSFIIYFYFSKYNDSHDTFSTLS